MNKFWKDNSVRITGLAAAAVVWVETRWPHIPVEAVLAAVAGIIGAAEASQRTENADTTAALYSSPGITMASVPGHVAAGEMVAAAGAPAERRP